MKTAYIDTNVLVARFKPNDRYYQSSCKLMELPLLRRVSSALTIIEFISAISRQFEEIIPSIEEKEDQILFENLTQSEQIIILSRILLRKLPVEFYQTSEILKLRVLERELNVPTEYAFCANIAPELCLRTLDNLQIATMATLAQSIIDETDFFVTDDNEVLSKKEKILELTGVVVLSSEEITRVLS